MEKDFFPIDNAAIEYLKKKDKKLAAAIEKLGRIERNVNRDLFQSLVYSIIGQQITMKAHKSIWLRLNDILGKVTPESVAVADEAKIKSAGLSFRKVAYIKSLAAKVVSSEIDLNKIAALPDEEVISALAALDGIGRWTAEMQLIFSLCRPDVLSFGDLAIQRGLRMLYRHKKITPSLHEKYRRRYSPYATTASFYLWAVAGGAIEGLSDPAAAAKSDKGKKKTALKS